MIAGHDNVRSNGIASSKVEMPVITAHAFVTVADTEVGFTCMFSDVFGRQFTGEGR